MVQRDDLLINTYLIALFAIALVIAGYILIVIIDVPDVTKAVFSLGIVWAMDVAIKTYFGIDIATAFADISLSALALAMEPDQVILSTYGFHLGPTQWLLIFLWIVNLIVCGTVERLGHSRPSSPGPSWSIDGLVCISGVCGSLSAFIILAPYFR